MSILIDACMPVCMSNNVIVFRPAYQVLYLHGCHLSLL